MKLLSLELPAFNGVFLERGSRFVTFEADVVEVEESGGGDDSGGRKPPGPGGFEFIQIDRRK